MKRIVLFSLVLVLIIVMTAGCTPTEISSPTEAATAAATVSKTLPFDEVDWERYVDWYDDDVGIGGPVIPDLHDYCLASILVKVTNWTEHGCEAEVLAPYEVDYATDLSQESYFFYELSNRIKAGDTVTVNFDDDSLIVYDVSHYLAWKHGVPSGQELPAGTVVSVGVSKMDADNEISSDYMAYGDDVNYLTDELQEWEEALDSSRLPLPELPYAVVKIEDWTITNRRIFEFSYDVLEKSDSLTWHIGTKLKQGNVMYAVPEQGIVGFDAPSPDEFPVGTVLKIYYYNEYDGAVYLEPIEWNE